MRRLEQDESEWEGSLRRASIVHYSRGKQARENANGGAPAARATCWAALGRAVTNVYSGASTTHENDEFMSTFGDCHKELEEKGAHLFSSALPVMYLFYKALKTSIRLSTTMPIRYLYFRRHSLRPDGVAQHL